MSSFGSEINLKQLLAKNILFLMNIYGKARKDVCNDLDISYTTFTDWVKGNTYPRMDSLESLSYYFKINTRDFFLDIEKNSALVSRLKTYAKGIDAVNMNKLEPGIFKTADYFELPEGYPVELINGHFYTITDGPTSRHQSIVSELTLLIGNHIKKGKGKCRIFTGPFDVDLLSIDDDTVISPDITVICDPNIIKRIGCKGAPDWIIEVLSKSTASKDKNVKKKACEEAGVREYWLIDPKNNEVITYTLDGSAEKFKYKKAKKYSFSDSIPSGIYEDLTVCMDELDILY